MLDLATDRNISSEIVHVNLRGRIDTLTAADFDRFFDEMMQAGNRYYILDATHLASISSAGISALIRLVRTLSRIHGRLALVRPAPELQQLLQFFALNKSIPFFADRQAAIKYIQKQIPAIPGGLHLDAQRQEAIQPVLDSVRDQNRSRPIPETAANPIYDPDRVPPSHAGPMHQKISYSDAGDSSSDHNSISNYSTGDAQSEAGEEMPRALPVETVALAKPKVQRCKNCGVGLRIYQSGRHLCAGCGIEFDVGSNGQTYYMQQS